MSAKVLLLIFVLFSYPEPRCLTKACFICGLSPSWSKEGNTSICTPLQLFPGGSGQKLLPVLVFLFLFSLSARRAPINFGSSSWVSVEPLFPRETWSQCFVPQSYWRQPWLSLDVWNQFSRPAEVCLSDDINSKYSTKSSLQNWRPEEFCHFPRNLLGSQKALAYLLQGIAKCCSETGTQGCSAAEKHWLWAWGHLHPRSGGYHYRL